MSPPQLEEGMVLSAINSTFEELRVSVSLRTPEGWHPFHSVPNVAWFELAHGTDMPRWAYNDRCYRRAVRERRLVRGEHAGFCDFSMPVFQAEKVRGVLVVGPFSTRRPTSGELLSRWRWLSGGHGYLGDPDFSHYVSMTFDTLTLDKAQCAELERVLEHFSALLGGQPRTVRILPELAASRSKLNEARFADRMWDAARSMIDERKTALWRSAAQINVLAGLGFTRAPEHVVVGLLLGRSSDADPVDDIFKREAFQRACVDFARKTRGIACARIGDHGVALLVEGGEKGARRPPRLLEIGNRVATLARRAGFNLHLGLSSFEDGAALPARYQAALAAAERALSEGTVVAHADRVGAPHKASLSLLRRQLAEAPATSPGLLSPLFERYVEAVAIHCRYQLDATRAHLEVGFDQLIDGLSTADSLDPKSAAGLRVRIEKGAGAANTIHDLSAVYRSVISDLETAILRPTQGRRDRGVQRAVAFIRDHLGERLTLGQVARVAGFAPRYFSRLFLQAEGKLFRRYLRQSRLARARQLLLSTTLSIDRVAKICGFEARAHFHRAFKNAFRVTPAEYRKDRPLDGTLPPARRSRQKRAHSA